jgi:nicotinate-nucleotide--dimethylbenzimidazole phosphoribosyltransferase
MNKHNTNPLDRKLSEILLGISPLDEDAMLKASAHQAILAKPPGSLGMLEDISVRLSGITGKVKKRNSE